MTRSRLRYSWKSVALAVICLSISDGQTLADLQWQPGAGFRFAALPGPRGGQAGFTQLRSSDPGITFSNRLSEAAISTNRLSANGSGVALGDVDGDGWVDIYFCNLEGKNALFRNLGLWRFQDITSSAGVACGN